VSFANAQTFVIDGLQYTVTTGTDVSVNKDGACPTGALTIPSLVTDTSTNIEYTVRTIENYAFQNCSGLSSLTLPNSLNSIGESTFENCSALTEVTVDWQTPLAINSNVFTGLTLSNVILNVPEEKIATYEAVSVWTNFSPIRATHNFSQTACESFEFGDSTYTVSGVYNDTITTTENNDSISRINLIILQIPDTNSIVTACESFTFGDSTYINSGTYSDTLMAMAANGCDSVVTLDLTINNSNTGTDTQTACDSYTWIDGNTYTESNTTATHTLTNVAGCDSVVTLDLTILESTSSTFSWTDQESIIWNSLIIDESIDTTITLINTVGCDSVINISITIEELTNIDDSYNFNANIYPNPTKNTATIKSKELGNYKVLNAYGKVILKGEKTSLNQEIDLSEFSNGLYLIRLNGKTHLIIKQ
jgi:hypothetical protein